GHFLTDTPVGVAREIIENPKESLRNAGQGVVGLAKGVPNFIAETLTQSAIGIRYLAVGGAELVGLAPAGSLDKEIEQYRDFSGRLFEYDNSAQEAAGFVSGFATPGVAAKATTAAMDLYRATRTAVGASEAWAAGQAERV